LLFCRQHHFAFIFVCAAQDLFLQDVLIFNLALIWYVFYPVFDTSAFIFIGNSADPQQRLRDKVRETLSYWNNWREASEVVNRVNRTLRG
jgi:hypothetical protein